MAQNSWQAHFGGNPNVGPIANRVLLHPSGDAFVTTGTDGRIRLWDLHTYECLREIKPFEHSTLPNTIAWSGNTLLCAGKDGSPANVCGDFSRVIAWDLAQLRLDDGATESCNDIVPPCNIALALWVFGSRVVISARRKGRGIIEVWSGLHETA
jgi:WD40 repeat protein